MKLAVLLLFLFSTNLLTAQEAKITARFQNTPVEEVIGQLEQQSDYHFSYESTLLFGFPPVTQDFHAAPLKEVLTKIFGANHIACKFTGQYIILKKIRRIPVISGTVIDARSKETLINATLYDPAQQIGTVTNTHGRYSLSFPNNEINLIVSYVGYKTWSSHFRLSKDTTIVIALEPKLTLEEVVVKGNAFSQWIKNTQPGQTSFPIRTVNKLPSLFNESDLLKTIQLLPGVKTGTEGMSGLFVRGGNMDENLYLMDGIPIYNPTHLMGFFSTFNSDAVKNVEFYRGSFPARFGGRLSSIVDVRLKDGNMQEYHGNISLGLIASKFNLEGPIVRNKTAFNVSGRRTYADLIASPLIRKYMSDDTEKIKAGYYFADLNAKITHKFSDRSRLSVYGYWGNDKLHYKDKLNELNNYYESFEITGVEKQSTRWNWGNIIAATEWNYNISNRLNMNVATAYNQYLSFIRTEYKQEDYWDISPSFSSANRNFDSGIRDIIVKSDFTYSLNHWNKIRFGNNYTFHNFIPETSKTTIQNSQVDEVPFFGYEKNKSKIQAHEFSLYAEDEITLGSRFLLNTGIHLSLFHVEGKTYFSAQPRVSLQYTPAEHLSLKASYTEMNQYTHLLSMSGLNMPSDLWVPVTRRIRPMYSRQVAAGIYYLLKGQWDFSLEGYYKTMNHQIDYREGASMMPNYKNWDEKVALGKGNAYGMEVQLQKAKGKTTGWFNYTLAWANRRFPGKEINNGEQYPAKYDNRHGVNIAIMHKFSNRFDISAVWVYNSGSRITLSLERYNSTPTLPGGDDLIHSQEYEHYDHRNNYRMDAYHRMDIGFNFHKQKRRGMRTWSVNFYNAYCRMNPFNIYTDEERQGGKRRATLSKTALFPILPSFSYTFTF